MEDHQLPKLQGVLYGWSRASRSSLAYQARPDFAPHDGLRERLITLSGASTARYRMLHANESSRASG